LLDTFAGESGVAAGGGGAVSDPHAKGPEASPRAD
jgi:hypothetical protein